MALPTLDVLDKDAAPQTISTLRSARAAADDSAGVVLSTEDKAVLDSLATKLDTVITALQIVDNMVLAAGTANIGDVDVLTLGGQSPAFGSGAVGATVLRIALATDSPGVVATVAHDAADSGDPIKFGAKAAAGLSGATLVAAADRTNAVSGLDGAIFVRHVPLEDLIDGNATNTDGTSTSVIATAGASIKQYIEQAIFANEHVSTVAYVVLKSGTTARTGRLCVPPGGATYTFKAPLKPNAADEAWSFDPDAAVTTLSCTLLGFKSKI